MRVGLMRMPARAGAAPGEVETGLFGNVRLSDESLEAYGSLRSGAVLRDLFAAPRLDPIGDCVLRVRRGAQPV